MNRFPKTLVLGLVVGVLFAVPVQPASKKQPVTAAKKEAKQSETSTTSSSNQAAAAQTRGASEHVVRKPSNTAASRTVTSAKRPVSKPQSLPAKSPDDRVPAPKEIESPVQSPAGAATYEIRWQSINAGGQSSTSPSYDVISSAGQAAIGEATSASYNVGVGYVYGLGISCDCPFQCDYDADGFLTSLDLGSLIDVLFAGNPTITDPSCPTPRADFDCDGFPTSLDLGGLIDHLFAGGSPPCNPCVH